MVELVKFGGHFYTIDLVVGACVNDHIWVEQKGDYARVIDSYISKDKVIYHVKED